MVAGSHMLNLSRYYSADESVEPFPTLARKGSGRNLKGTVVYYDGQMNDSRLNVRLACTSFLAGAAVLNYKVVVSLVKDDLNGRIVGAHITDNISGTTNWCFGIYCFIFPLQCVLFYNLVYISLFY